MPSSRTKSVFVESCWGRRSPDVPLWFLRQAGRYLPEYRELRQSASYRELCLTPELAAEAACLPIRRFGLDAAHAFTDPLLCLEAIGREVVFEGGAPSVATPVRTRSDVEGLVFEDAISSRLPQLEACTRTAVEALGTTPLVAVAGGPFTLAGYLVEGRASRSHRHLKAFLYNDPTTAHTLFEQLAVVAADALAVQLRAGAKAVLLVDSWAGLLTARDYRDFVLPYVADMFRRLRMFRAPGIIYVNTAGHLVDLLVRTEVEVVALDWRHELESIRTRLPENVSIMGNLDPTVLLGPLEEIRERVIDVLIQGTLYRGHIMSLGGGMLPDTPIEAVQTLVDVVRDFDPRLQGWSSVRS